MPQLYDRSRHENLTTDPWHEGLVREAIDEIVADTLHGQDGGFWPPHPLDEGAEIRTKSLYFGAAGVIWGLLHLARAGAIPEDRRFSQWAISLPERYAGEPDTGSIIPSYFFGGAGVLLLAFRERRDPETARCLFDLIEANRDHPARELLVGAPGTMLAAVFAHEVTGEDRWRSLYLRNVDALMRVWRENPDDRLEMWTQALHGGHRRYLGAAHGFAGNVFALLRGWKLLSESQRTLIRERAVRTLTATAVIEDGEANWPPEPESPHFLVQWCHGAPGIVTSFARFPPDPALDELLLKAGKLVWRAEPLRKGPNLCHGTAGNGAAFLALFARTGEQIWLERARRFAMHSILQVKAARAKYGRGRYALWTGDIGVAVYLWQCLTAGSGLPALDF
jgi:hypothetical protein